LLTPDELVIDMPWSGWRARPEQGFVLDGLAHAARRSRSTGWRGGEVDRPRGHHAPDDVLLERMMGRATESSRSDDTPEAMRVRLEKQKPPAELLDHYRRPGKLIEVDGVPGVEAVTAAIAAALRLERAAWEASR
jgi:adenylate kinase